MSEATHHRGRFVVIEGIDGVGKTTICSLLKSELERRNECCEIVYGVPQPFSEIASAVAQVGNVFSRYHFYMASNYLLAETVARRAPNVNVIADRYVFSTYAYHLARGLDIPAPKFSPGHLLMPNLGILLSVRDEAIRRLRLVARGSLSPDDYEERSEGSFAWKVEQTFRELGLTEVDNSTDDPLVAVREIVRLLREEEGLSSRHGVFSA